MRFLFGPLILATLALCAACTAGDPAASTDDDDESVGASEDELRSSNYWAASSCSGPALTQADMLAYFDRGSLEAGKVGTFYTFNRQRTCTKLTGCTPWKEYERVGFEGYSDVPLPSRGAVTLSITDEISWTPAVPTFTVVDYDRATYAHYRALCVLGSPGKLVCQRPTNSPSFHVNADANDVSIDEFEMKATKTCLRASFKSKPATDGREQWSEGESVLFVKLRAR